MATVLVIEDDEKIRENVLELLEAEGFSGIGAADGKLGLAQALENPPDVVVCDILMPAMDGHAVLRALRDHPETACIPFIFLTARAQRADVREGMSLGAEDYLTKPFTREELLSSIRTRLERRAALEESLSSPTSRTSSTDGDPGLIIESARMRSLFETAKKAAQSDLSVLLLGETGVGKDVLAHAIHKESLRADAPYMPLNCAAIPESLIESELFGHEKSAFTHATHDQPGLFEVARGGTVFLDEVGELSPAVQAKLLRVIDDRRVMPVGGRSFRDVDVRFVAATNRDLESEVARGTFRQDLFFRLTGLSLTVPPLRERREEIEPLARRFVREQCHHLGRSLEPTLAPDTRNALADYSWPGNVRELKNAIEQAVTLCEGAQILPEHLPARVLSGGARSGLDEKEQLLDKIEDLDKRRTLEALEQCAGNQTKAAKLLGISRRTLLNRLDEYQVRRPRKK